MKAPRSPVPNSVHEPERLPGPDEAPAAGPHSGRAVGAPLERLLGVMRGDAPCGASTEDRLGGARRSALPLDACRVERAEDGVGLLVTLSTPGGFEVTFSCREEFLLRVAEVLLDYEIEAEPGGLVVH